MSLASLLQNAPRARTSQHDSPSCLSRKHHHRCPCKNYTSPSQFFNNATNLTYVAFVCARANQQPQKSRIAFLRQKESALLSCEMHHAQELHNTTHHPVFHENNRHCLPCENYTSLSQFFNNATDLTYVALSAQEQANRKKNSIALPEIAFAKIVEFSCCSGFFLLPK